MYIVGDTWAMNTFNIVSLIEDKSVCNLSNDYNNKLLNKIKEQFTEHQQQLFVASFYCYLKYSQTADFVVDLDTVWTWIGFGTKADSKKALKKYFTLDKDYKCSTCHLAGEKKGRGGGNKETVLMTVKTFKLFCIKSSTKKADEIHEYYVKLEELLQETILEETNELRLQVEKRGMELEYKNKEIAAKDGEIAAKDGEIEEKTTKLAKTKAEKERLRERTLIEQFPENTQCIYYGYIDNTNDQREKLVKFGHTNNLTRRCQQHFKTFVNFRLVNAFRVENKQLVENAIKNHAVLNKLRRPLLVGEVNQLEILAIGGITITELDKHIRDIIVSNEFTTENFLALVKENERLAVDHLLLNETNERLQLENKRLMRLCKKIPTAAIPQNTVAHIDEPTQIPTPTQSDNEYVGSLKQGKRKDGFYYLNGVKYGKLHGSREEVWSGVAIKTTGNLLKDDLVCNKDNVVVSKKKYIRSKLINNFNI
jgi:hypothetical protein